MPTYTFFCEKCEKVFELVCSIREYTDKPVCEFCKSKNVIRRYIEDLSTLNTSIKKNDSELKTLGDLANRNRDRLSDDEKIHLYNRHNEYKEETPKTELPKNMTRMKKTKGTKWV